MAAVLVVFLPLLAAILVGFRVRIISAKSAENITSIFVATAAFISYIVFYKVALHEHIIHRTILEWFTIGSLKVNWAIYVDALTASMFVLVTTVSALVHIYSKGYMHEDPHRQRFMCYLSLFTFFMLVLVSADNFIQMFVGWEGVGLCSYLLIGFWFKKASANSAAMKAFIVNRVGDFGLMLGIAAIFMLFDSLNYADVFVAAESRSEFFISFLGMDMHALTLVCVLLFIGCMGKSAQLGLHTWLPDAMEGPTPVSALIHAATMVTAGVFLVARCSPLFELSEFALGLVTLVGATTAIFAASIALTQNDIKRVIAYSTCSQLGYMFFACGVSAYAAGVFHLLTHGFFKALLFLCAGSVIHALHHEQDMRNMGGIRKKIPYTYAMMVIGTLAITGFPFLSGYFSKDMILESAWAAGHEGRMFANYAFWVGIITALLTTFYSWRLIFLTFHGRARMDKHTLDGAHESPKIMLVPLMVLVIGALFSGAYGYYALHITGGDMHFWNGALFMDTAEFNVLEEAHHVPTWVKVLPFAMMVSGFLVAYFLYVLNPELPNKIAMKMRALYNASFNKWYIDEIYDALFVKPTKHLGSILWKVGDVIIIDGLGPNGFAAVAKYVGRGMSAIHTGFIYHYAFIMLLGLILIIGLAMW